MQVKIDWFLSLITSVVNLLTYLWLICCEKSSIYLYIYQSENTNATTYIPSTAATTISNITSTNTKTNTNANTNYFNSTKKGNRYFQSH